MPRKATSKSKKKSDAENPELPAMEKPGTRHEPDEPELNAAAQASLEEQAGGPGNAVTRVVPEPEAEAMAEAADTFEQAYEERRPPQRPELVVDGDPAEPEQGEDGGESQEDHPVSVDEGEGSEEEPRPAHMERLQKILSQAGIASRRHAEEMITEGRVQVNGKVVTELGSKADAERDHIRVDGKLIRGAERLRYFVLNKPRGYVTTVSDPEGRPTVMEFFKKAGERLYPVGRLDYNSEGLLLVTNDGDLANKLTKAATGVEKTYLVKVSGQPTEEELDRLREGIGIDRGRPGEGRVQTAPATIQEARQGENPWYEVVLIEGRNRELRKMFEEIGHRVEKIRRVGYGPLVLDVEPGQFRELDSQELDKLRLAAEGKWRRPKPKEPRREGGRRAAGPSEKPAPGKRFESPKKFGPGKSYESGRKFGSEKTFAPGKKFESPKKFDSPKKFGPAKKFAGEERFAAGGRPPRRDGAGTGRRVEEGDRRRAPESRPTWSSRGTGSQRFTGQGQRGPRPAEGDRGARGAGAWKPQPGKPQRASGGFDRDRGAREDRRAGDAPRLREDRPRFERPRTERPERAGFQEDRGGQRPRRGPGGPPKKYGSSQTERPARFTRREGAPSGGQRRQEGGPPSTGRGGGRSNWKPAAGRGPGRPARPPFKGTSGGSGRRPPSNRRPGGDSPRGRGRRPE
jgi:23S rRNA pseudouridine2605 synthase